jgi:hypothetical protein
MIPPPHGAPPAVLIAIRRFAPKKNLTGPTIRFLVFC